MSTQNVHIPTWLVPAGFLFYLIVNVCTWNFPFFWDTLLTSTITTWYFHNGMIGESLPTLIDAGHPPVFYGYLLSWWKLLGRTLPAAHLAMLPILWVMFYQFVQLGARWLTSTNALIAAAGLFCLETTILAQSTLVSYDIALLCLYICGLRYLFDRKPVQVMIICLALSFISLRGVYGVLGLVATEMIILKTNRKLWKVLLKYAPALVLFVVWNGLHYLWTGWMLSTPSEHWAGQRGWTDPGGIIRNLVVVARVLLEPGRLLLYLLLAYGIYHRYAIRQLDTLKNLLWMTAIPLVLFTLGFIPFNNPIGHRYYMIIFALSILLFIRITEQWKKGTYARWAVALVFISGHFWVYPSPISKGWDASLAYVPYFKARAAMQQYLDASLIPLTDVAADFPLEVSGDQYALNGQLERPQAFGAVDTLNFVMVSNVNNDISEGDLEWLDKHCLMVRQVRQKWVYIRLYDCEGKRFQ